MHNRHLFRNLGMMLKRELCGMLGLVAASLGTAAEPAPLPQIVPLTEAGESTPKATAVTTATSPRVSNAPSNSSGGTSGCGDACPRGGHCGQGIRGWFCQKFPCACTPATSVPPLGDAVRRTFDTQVVNALGEYFVIYREDWLQQSSTLNPTGLRHFDGIVRRLHRGLSPIKVEPTGDAAVDEARRAAVVSLLIDKGFPALEAQAMVVVQGTRAEGLRHQHIEQVYRRGYFLGTGFGLGGFGAFSNLPGMGGFAPIGGFLR